MVIVRHPDHGTGQVLDIYPAGSWGTRQDGSSVPDKDYMFIWWNERRDTDGDICGFYDPCDENLTLENAVEFARISRQALEG